MLPQDLHLHTVFSKDDDAVVPQQTAELIGRVRHAKDIGISDHLESIPESVFPHYEYVVRSEGFRLGAEVGHVSDVDYALELPLDYRVFHCKDTDACYEAAERMVDSGAPLIIAHPMVMGTDPSRLPPDCFLEINNRYVWRNDWKSFYTPWLNRFRFVISSDAHQPNWLNQTVARYAAAELDVSETLIFADKPNPVRIAAAIV